LKRVVLIIQREFQKSGKAGNGRIHSKIKFLATFSGKNRIGRVKMVLTCKKKVINRQKANSFEIGSSNLNTGKPVYDE